MQKIVPHLWFDTQAKEATAFYATLFPNSHIDTVTTITGTPSGDCDTVDFTLAGQKFMAISAGPYFKFNPSISFFVTFDTEEEIARVWNLLVEGGKVLMAYDTYPWAKKYGWLEDKYGLSWQLSMSEFHDMGQKITPLCMFTGAVAGKAKEAIDTYQHIFKNSNIELIAHYDRNDGDSVENIKHARFTLEGVNFMAMDSSYPHGFVFNEAISFLIKCDTQEEIDYYSNALSAFPESEQCGWVKDKYGLSWQITPSRMDEMMASGNRAAIDRVTKAFLQMKRFDIAAIEAAFKG